jgi:four helix bundle protein
MVRAAADWCDCLDGAARTFAMHDFRRLQVWQRSREIAVALDALTREFPRSDRGVVAGQLRRAVLSIPANIAEGCGKSSRRETIRFLQIASGSARETENHLLIAADLGYVSARDRDELTDRVKTIQRMLAALMNKLPA